MLFLLWQKLNSSSQSNGASACGASITGSLRLWIERPLTWSLNSRPLFFTRKENQLATTFDKLAYKVKTFASLCELSERFVKQEIYDGNLRAIKTGNRWRIPADAAREYLTKKEEAQDQVQSLATAA
jgi:excisionase family DNA binding protein